MSASSVDPILCPTEGRAIQLVRLLRDYESVRAKVPQFNTDRLVELAQGAAELRLFTNGAAVWEYTGAEGNRWLARIPPLPVTFRALAVDLIRSAREDDSLLRMSRVVSRLLATDLPIEERCAIAEIESQVLSPNYWLWLRQVQLDDVKALFILRQEFAACSGAKTPPGRDWAKRVFDAYLRDHLRFYVDRSLHPAGAELLLQVAEAMRGEAHFAVAAAMRLVLFNNVYATWPKDVLRSRLSTIVDVLPADDRDAIAYANTTTFDKVEFKEFSLYQLDHQLTAVDASALTTRIHFVVPYPLRAGAAEVTTEDGTIVQFAPLDSQLADPVFRMLDQLGTRFNDMPVAAFSDSFPNFASSSLVTVVLLEFFHPDFDICDGEAVEVNVEEESARIGRRYHPVKERVVAVLRDIGKRLEGSFPLDIEVSSIDLNVFSAYLVDYRDQVGNSVYHRAHILTTWDKYPAVVRTIGDLRRQETATDFFSLKSLVNQTPAPDCIGELASLVHQFIDLAFRRAVEQKGAWQYLWTGLSPVQESIAQPLFETHVGPLLGIKGVQLSREVLCANGRLDFLCSCTSRAGQVLSVCIEMKNAHHSRLFDGVEKQLPAYMRAQGTRHGVLLVLWYKGPIFNGPAAFVSMQACHDALAARVPTGLNIDVVVVDCTKPISPSKM